jgi:SRSO17 transposase
MSTVENLACYVDREEKIWVELIVSAQVLERISLCWLLGTSVRKTRRFLRTDVPSSQHKIIEWRQGTKGTIQAQVLALRVHWATGSQRHSTSHSRVHTGPEGWLLAERCVPTPQSQELAIDEPVSPADTSKQEVAGEQEVEKIKYWFSTLPSDIPLERLVTLAHARWVIEQFDEDAKQECGLDDFQGRRWDGLHRHLALVMLAYTFLALQRFQLPLPAGEAFPPLGHT